MNDDLNAPDSPPPVLRRLHPEVTGSEIAAAPAPAPPAHAKEAPSPLLVVHNALRGRYGLVIALGIFTAGLFAAAAFKLIRPKYTSEGLVRIAYVMPQVRESTDQNSPVPMFETFMASQKTLITSRRVIDMALQQPAWRAFGRSPPQNADQYFAENLIVDIKNRSELIRITVQDIDPYTAAAATTAVINSYADLYNSTDKQVENQRINLLVDQQGKIQLRIKAAMEDLSNSATEYGTTKLDVFYNAAVANVMKIQAALNDINLALVTGPPTETPAPAPAPTEDPSAAFSDLTPKMIARTDGQMRAYLDEQEHRQDDLTRLLQSYPETHPQVTAAKQRLDRVNQHISESLEMYRQFHSATSQNLSDRFNSHVATAGLSPDALRANAAKLNTMLATSREVMVKLGQQQLALERKEADLADLQAEQEKLNKRVEVLRGENLLGGRLSVVSTGEVPISPSSDRRWKLAPAAGAVGMILPAGVFVLLSFVKRRYRYAEDTMKDHSLSNIPLLGMLPEVGRKFDAEIMHATAHGIHQMRVLLSARAPKDLKRSYLITSATEGEGKTNLTVALGMSFAAARCRTLVIDCDFVGRRLTHGFKAEQGEGLLEAMREGRIGSRVREEAPLLYILPTGRARAADACGITTESVRTMLQQAYKDFDTVLIDTGPILGSLEAAVLAQEVDGVILTISRGQHPALVEHALRRLNSVRARIVGAVFNRAKLGDFHGSAYTSSQASSPAPGDLSFEEAKVRGNFSEFGPLVRAVSLATPAAA